MSNPNASTQENFFYVEVTAAITKLMKDRIAQMKGKYDAGSLAGEDFAKGLMGAYTQSSEVLSLYAARAAALGYADTSARLTAWGQTFDAVNASGQGKLDAGDILGAIKDSVAIGHGAMDAEDVKNFFDQRVMEGSGERVAKFFKAAEKLGTAVDVATPMKQYFDGDSLAAAATVSGILGSALASWALGPQAGAPVTAVLLAGLVAFGVGRLADWGFEEVASAFGWEDEEAVREAILDGLGNGNDVFMAHVGDHLFWGTDGDDYLVPLDDKRNDMFGAEGNDELDGGEQDDHLSGGTGNDTLEGRGGKDWLVGGGGNDSLDSGADEDRLEGGDGDDTLVGGGGSDTLAGGAGHDRYVFTTADLTDAVTTDVIEDADGDGAIVIDVNEIDVLGVNPDTTIKTDVNAWETMDGKYLFAWSGQSKSLIITVRESGSRIIVNNWTSGDLGIDMPSFDETHPIGSAPLTEGNDVFGKGGDNAGNDNLTALGGNDGISTGIGNDAVDAGSGVDVVYCGPGDDRISGGDDRDFLVDDSEWDDMQDWSDQLGPDGKSQRDRAEDDIDRLGAAVVGVGKGWYVYKSDDAGAGTYVIVKAGAFGMLDPNQLPSGDDLLDGGRGDDLIWAGEGRDTVIGGEGNDYLNGGADDDVIASGEGNDQIWGDTPAQLIADGALVALASDDAKQGGNDVIYGGDGNDTVIAGGGSDLVDGGDGDDWLRGNGDGVLADPDDPDADVLFGGAGNDTAVGDDGDDSLYGGAGDDHLEGDNGEDTTRYGNDLLDGGAGIDTLVGGLGDDVLHGGDDGDLLAGDATDADGSKHGDDILFGEGGDDTLIGGGGSDTLLGGADSDLLIGDDDAAVLDPSHHGDDFLDGGVGNDSLYGLGGNDTLFGGDGDDVVGGGTGNDVLYGGAGTDQVIGDDGDDTVDGGDGNDTLWGALGNDVVSGGEGDDAIMGDAPDLPLEQHGNDVLDGGAGSDSLYGGGGNDALYGGDGDDELYGNDGNDSLHGGAGNDYLGDDLGTNALYGDAGSDTLIGGDGSDTLAGGVGDDALVGGYGINTFVVAPGEGDDKIYGFGAGIPTGAVVGGVLQLDGGLAPADIHLTRGGDDLLVSYKGGSVAIQGYFLQYDPNAPSQGGYGGGPHYSFSPVTSIVFSDGTRWGLADVQAALIQPTGDSDRIVGFDGGETIHGADGDDTIQAMGGNDVVYGDAGNDQLDGGIGNDQLFGGTGDDSLLGSDGADELQGGDGADTADGGSGDDRLSGGTGDDSLRGGEGADTLQGDDGNDALDGGAGSDFVLGGAGNDALLGGDGDDLLDGGAGDDQLAGGTGDDTLTGGSGNDDLDGGAGANTYAFARGDGNDTLQDAFAIAPVLALSGFALGDLAFRREGNTLQIAFADSPDDGIALQSYFTGDEAESGLTLRWDDGTESAFDFVQIRQLTLQGSDVGELIEGYAGDDTITALGGDDTVHAGAGDDMVDAGNGDDEVDGGDGNDQLVGGAGLDVLDGGAGQDVMHGGSGDDIYVVDDVRDVVVEQADEGVDSVRSTVTRTLGANIERLELLASAAVDGTGNALDNELLGNSSANHLAGLDGDDTLQGNAGDDTLVGGIGNDLLDGGSGVDQMAGGAGDDIYVVDVEGDLIEERAGEGVDVVNARSSYALSANIEQLVLVEGTAATQGTGNDGANVITGNSASNRLDGGAAADLLTGGQGNDVYVVDDAGDEVVEVAGEGVDTVESSIDYVLGADLENLTLLGTANLNGTGNAADNVIIGNAGDNRLEGGAGNDVLRGGAGNDWFVEESSGDRVVEYANEGLDTVERRFETNLVLRENVENLVLASGIKTGNGNGLDNLIIGNASANTLGGWGGDDTLEGLDGDDALFGVAGDDTLRGGAGNDYLDGGVGVDRLEGGTGDDNYVVDDSDDVVVEAANAGLDQVQATASYTLAANVENLFLTGSAAIEGTGNDLDNYIAGNAAANVIRGGGGGDTLVAGGGDDTVIGGTGDDKYVFDADSGCDVIDNTGGGFDGAFFTNGITRERLSFTRDGDDLLIFVDAAATPSVRVTHHFLGGDAAIDYVQPDGGYYLTTQQINQIVAAGNTGGAFDQVIEGTAAGEQLVGSAGKDLIRGLAGNDQLFGMAGNDALEGGDGDDYLGGGNGSGTGSGDDHLEGGAGNDTFAAEDGANTLVGGTGDDKYIYGGGQDTIDNRDGGFDGVFFNNGITASQLGFSRDGDDLLITVSGAADHTVRVTDHFLGGDAAIDYVQPASGYMLDTAAINALVDAGSGGDAPPAGGDTGGSTGGEGDTGNDGDYGNVVDGTAAGEQLLGSEGRDLIHGLGGNDTLFGFGGDDKLEGGDGDDYLSGGNGSFSGSGNDILMGGAGVDTLVGEDGNDTLLGGAGNDKYVWQAGSGSDVIDNTGGGTDWLFFNGVDRSRLGFHRDGDDLVIQVDGDAAQQVRVLNHFLGGDAAIGYVQPSGGYAIPASQFAGLLTPLAGAGFAAGSATKPAATLAQSGLSRVSPGLAALAPSAAEGGVPPATPMELPPQHVWPIGVGHAAMRPSAPPGVASTLGRGVLPVPSRYGTGRGYPAGRPAHAAAGASPTRRALSGVSVTSAADVAFDAWALWDDGSTRVRGGASVPPRGGTPNPAPLHQLVDAMARFGAPAAATVHEGRAVDWRDVVPAIGSVALHRDGPFLRAAAR